MTITRLSNNVKTNSTERLIEEEVIKVSGTKVVPLKVFYDNTATLTDASSSEITKNTVTIPAGTFPGKVTLVITGGVQYWQTDVTTATYTTTSKLKINTVAKITNSKTAQASITDDDLAYSRMSDLLIWTEKDVDNSSDIVITVTGQWNYSHANWNIQGVPLSVIAIQE